MKRPIILAALLTAVVALILWLAGGWGTPDQETPSAEPSEPEITRPEPLPAEPSQGTTGSGSSPEPTTSETSKEAAPNGAGDPLLEGERHPSAAPTPSDFTWPEPAPSHTPNSPDAEPRSMPDLQKAAKDPRELSRAFTVAMWTHDTATDASEHEAVERACQVCTAELAELMAAGEGLNPSTQWDELVQAKGWTTATVEENTDQAAKPSDPTKEQWFSWIVTPELHGVSGDPQEIEPVTYVLVVDPDGDGVWEVDGYQLR